MTYSLNTHALGSQSPTSIMVLCHGYGANGQDLIGLAPHFLETFPDLLVLSPDAPEPCPGIAGGRQWFPLTDLSAAELIRGTAQATPGLIDYLHTVLATHQRPWSDLILLGFSQGTMVALSALLNLPQPPRCVIGFSGALAGQAPKAVSAMRPPVLLIHGTDDTLVPEEASKRAQTQLASLGYPVEYHPRPGLGHAIDPKGLKIALNFLAECLPYKT